MNERRSQANAPLRAKVDALLKLNQQMNVLAQDIRTRALNTARGNPEISESQKSEEIVDQQKLKALRQLLSAVEKLDPDTVPALKQLTPEEISALFGSAEKGSEPAK